MTLFYLDFDYSEDEQGISTWDAMACVSVQRLPALLAEITLVLGWAQQQFAGQRGPLDEDGLWDYDLQSMPEGHTHMLALHYDEDTQQLTLAPPPPAHPPEARYTLTLTLSGTPAFAQALRVRFRLDDDQ